MGEDVTSSFLHVGFNLLTTNFLKASNMPAKDNSRHFPGCGSHNQ